MRDGGYFQVWSIKFFTKLNNKCQRLEKDIAAILAASLCQCAQPRVSRVFVRPWVPGEAQRSNAARRIMTMLKRRSSDGNQVIQTAVTTALNRIPVVAFYRA